MTWLLKAWHHHEAQLAETECRLAVTDMLIAGAHATTSAIPFDPREVARWSARAARRAKDAAGWRALQAWHERKAR